jgi:hypothetical protein
MGYGNVHVRGDYLYAKKNNSSSDSEEIGDFRIYLEKVPCGPTTIIAQ